MSDIKYQFMDDLGTQEVINMILEYGEITIDETLVDNLTSGTITNDQMPTALAVMTVIQELLNSEATNIKQGIDQLRSDYKELLERWIKLDSINAKVHFIKGNLATEVKDPNPADLYFHCIDEKKNLWTIAVYDPDQIDDPWIEVGNMKDTFLNYWKKTDIPKLREAIFKISNKVVPMSEDKIKAMVKYAVNTFIPD